MKTPSLLAGALLLSTVALTGTGLTGAGLASAGASRAAAATTLDWPSPSWVQQTGPIAQSSPSVFSFQGQTDVAVGDENGRVWVDDLATGRSLPGWPEQMAARPGQVVAIESSPTVAYLHGLHSPPEVIVTSGSTWRTTTVGEVEAFSIGGRPLWTFRVGRAAGTTAGVISTPAVGPLLANGAEDVVFGAWDHEIYGLDANGRLLPGFPFDNADTIWSSPALAHVPGTPGDSIFLGSDASGLVYNASGARCVGGFVGRYAYDGTRVAPVWRDCEPQVVWSSPVVTTGPGGHAIVLVGTGFYYSPFPAGTDRLLGLLASNGRPAPGWPAPTAGPVLGTPAVGEIAPGRIGVVDTTWECTGSTPSSCQTGRSAVVAWTLTGRRLWSQQLGGEQAFGSPVLTPLGAGAPGHGHVDDVLVSSIGGLYPLAGSSGAYLDGTSFADAVNGGCESLNSPAVGDTPSGWFVAMACGGPNRPSRITAYRLDVTAGALPAWPQFHGNADHTGTAQPPGPAG